MFRQSPRRNGRNKGLKIKHALQISLLLGVSIWLLYQVHHSDDKKAISVETNVNEKPRNDSSKGMFKLGRKDLRPKVMETSIKDSMEAEEHHEDEQGNGNGDEKLAHDHGSKDNEDGREYSKDNENGREYSKDNEDGIGKITKTENKQIEKVHGDKDHDQSDVINDNIQTGHEGEKKEDDDSKKEATKEGNKGNENENKKESLTARGKENKTKDQGKQKEVKELYKQNEEIKVKVNENKSNEQKKAVVMDKIERKDKLKGNGNEMSSNPKEPLSPSTDHHQSITEEVENESRKDDTSSSNVPSVDESLLGSSQSDNDASTNSATNSEKEKQGDGNHDNEVATLTQTVQQINTADSYSTPSVDHETAASVDGNLTDSNNSNRNEMNDEGNTDSGAQDMEQVPNENKDDASVLEDEKDALTDLGTLPDNGTGGHITSEDSDTE